jgi:hypothetical protein
MSERQLIVINAALLLSGCFLVATHGTEQRHPPDAVRVTAGSPLLDVRQIRSEWIDGSTQPFSFGADTTLILVFSPQCPVSAEVAAAWDQLTRHARQLGIGVLAASWDDEDRDQVRSYAARFYPLLDVLLIVADDLEAIGINMSPAAFLVGGFEILFVGQGRWEATDDILDFIRALHGAARSSTP